MWQCACCLFHAVSLHSLLLPRLFSFTHPCTPRPFGLPHPHLNTDHFIPRSLGTDGAWSECRPAWEIKKGSPSSVCIDHSSRWDNWDNTRPVYMTCKLLLSQFSFLSSFSNCPFNRPHCVLLIDFPTYLNCVLVKLFCLFHLMFLIYLKSSMCDILHYVWLLEKKWHCHWFALAYLHDEVFSCVLKDFLSSCILVVT